MNNIRLPLKLKSCYDFTLYSNPNKGASFFVSKVELSHLRTRLISVSYPFLWSWSRPYNLGWESKHLTLNSSASFLGWTLSSPDQNEVAQGLLQKIWHNLPQLFLSSLKHSLKIPKFVHLRQKFDLKKVKFDFQSILRIRWIIVKCKRDELSWV